MKKVSLILSSLWLCSTAASAGVVEIPVSGTTQYYNDDFAAAKLLRNYTANYGSGPDVWEYQTPNFIWENGCTSQESSERCSRYPGLVHQGGNFFVSKNHFDPTYISKYGSGASLSRSMDLTMAGREAGKTYSITVSQNFSVKSAAVITPWANYSYVTLYLTCWNGAKLDVSGNQSKDLDDYPGTWFKDQAITIKANVSPGQCPGNKIKVVAGVTKVNDIEFKDLEITILELGSAL